MESDSCILCVGRNRRNQELLSQVLRKAGYSVEVALSYEDLLPRVEARPIKLVLLDVTGFDEKVWPVCQVLQSHKVPLFIITAPNGSHIPSLYNATNCSSVPLLIKPLSIRPLLTLIAHSLSNSHE